MANAKNAQKLDLNGCPTTTEMGPLWAWQVSAGICEDLPFYRRPDVGHSGPVRYCPRVAIPSRDAISVLRPSQDVKPEHDFAGLERENA
ncbi:hypothetical protein LCM4576_29830 [Mesorhizobium sp. LCM 4576]|nr:hypothetical protein LCM4576_29830 [Mesorhizobium sp. LCM 4576]